MAKPTVVNSSKMMMALTASTKSLEVDEVKKDLRNETDEQIMTRLGERFDILDDMTRAVKRGDVRAMIVTGPPGVGKSYGVETVLAKHDVFATVAQNEKLKKYEVVKGAMSALGLYSKLYQYSDAKNILVFDDCDSVLLDDLSLNILKAALDTSKKRMIHWNTDSHMLRKEGIPDSFEFKGGAIFITNIKFDHVRSKKLRDHLEALESRCHYLDLTIDTEREKILRIKQIVRDGMLDSYEFEDTGVEDVLNFVTLNAKKMRELSLRTVLKVADLRKSFPDRWQAVAEVTCMRGAR
jgi:predicted AAA+ superfamily ATPase